MTTEKTLMVTTFDEEKVKQLIEKSVTKKKNQTFIISLGGLVGKNVITNDECCYSFLQNMFHNGKVQLVYEIPVRIKTKTKDGYTHSMIPNFYFPIGEDMLKDFVTGKQDLKTFMGSRYDYNPRIIKNMREFLKDIGSQLE